MGRLVSPIKRGAKSYGAGNVDGDNYLSRVAKYIPSEVIAGYLAVQNILTNSVGDCEVPSWWWYVLYAFFVVITPIYLYNQRTKGEPYKLHLFIATIAFVIWSYALTSCTKFGVFPKSIYDPAAAAVLLVVFSVAAGAFQPERQSTSASVATNAPPKADAPTTENMPDGTGRS